MNASHTHRAATFANGSTFSKPAARDGEMRRDGVWNEAERRPPPTKNLETDLLGLEALQLIEIPQNHQSFLWKSLEGNTLFLERLGKKLGDRLGSAGFITATPPHGCEPGISAQNSRARRVFPVCKIMVLPDRIELSTSPLPMRILSVAGCCALSRFWGISLSFQLSNVL